MKRVIYTTIDEFLRDDDFIRYVMDCQPDGDSYWASYLTAAPRIRSAYLKAYDILLHLDDCDLLSPAEAEALKRRIFRSIKSASCQYDPVSMS
ncbi:MAG: hypothetical protein IJ710_09855 [Prevotella sp.]|nr:hypothetical protein [Prevotella sp.]